MTKGAILILGGRSDIGLAIAARFAAEGHPVQLATRSADKLEMQRKDLELRHGVPVTLHEFDATDLAALLGFVAALDPLPEIVACVVGALGDPERSRHDPAHLAEILRANFEGPAAVLGVLADRFEARGHGTIIGVSSVAGERGRQSNYAYGSAKAGFTAFLSGLRNRLARSGVHVMTVKPGFVETRMTQGMDLPKRLTASPQEVAEAIWRAMGKKRDVLYVRPIWRPIMLAIRMVPEAVFKRLKM